MYDCMNSMTDNTATETEAKQSSLGSSHESLTTQASSVIQFTLEWKQFENFFDSARTSLQTRFAELEDRAAEIDCKAEELRTLETAAEQRRRDEEEGKSRLESIKCLIEENNEELKIREEEFIRVDKLIREKKREAEEVDKLIKERSRKLNWVKEKIEVKSKEFESKERQVTVVEEVLRKYEDDVEMGEKRLNDVEKELDLNRSYVERCEGELKAKEEGVRLMEASIAKCGEVLESKEKLIRAAKDAMVRCERDREVEEKKLRDVKGLLEEKKRELDEMEVKVVTKKWKIVGCDSELKGQVERLRSIEESIAKCSELLDSKRVLISTADLEEKEVMARYAKDRELEEKKLRDIRVLTEEKSKELSLKEDQLTVAQRSIDDCNNELKGKEESLRSLEESIANCSKVLESKQSLISVMDSKEKHFSLMTKAMEEWESKLELKEKELEGCVTKIEEKEKQVEVSVQELESIRSQFIEEVQLKEKHLDSLEKSLKKWEEDLHSLQESVQQCSQGSEISRNGKGLQQLMEEYLKRIDSICTELSSILQESSDPANMVLDAMQGFYPENNEIDLTLRVRRRACCFLLKELKRISPKISPQVREEATLLAASWKGKMRVGESADDLEVLGFLDLVIGYNLSSNYDAKELKRLVSSVSQGQQVAELRKALGIMSPVSRTPIKIEESESQPSASNNRVTISRRPSAYNNIVTTSSPNPQLSATNNIATVSSSNPQPSATTEARGSTVIIEPSSWNANTIQNEMVASVSSASDPGKFVLNILQNFFDKYWRSSEASFRKKIMSVISLLEVLRRVSPQVGSHVKEDAKKLALKWKAENRAGSEDIMEIVWFLSFIAAYGLLPTLNGDEIVKYLERLSQHKEGLMHHFSAKHLGVFVHTLLERKQLFQALRFIYAFELLDEFPPVQILKDYVTVNDGWKCRSSSVTLESYLADLKAVLGCIAHYNMESEYPSGVIAVEIDNLERLKENWKQEQSQGNKRSSAYSSTSQGQPQRSKVPRIVEGRHHYKPSIFTPVQLQAGSSSPPPPLAFSNIGQSRQLIGSEAANHSEIHSKRGHFGSMGSVLDEVHPRFGAIDRIDPHSGVHNLQNNNQFTPVPRRYGPL